VARLAGDRGRISRLPVVMARLLGVVISTALARSSVTPVVLRRAMIWQRGFSMRLVLAGHDDAVLASCATRLPMWFHHLLLQIGSVQEFLNLALLLPQVLAL
jgi:hypothetical protein